MARFNHGYRNFSGGATGLVRVRVRDLTTTTPILDQVPWASPGALEIGFHIPEHYNASELLFQNLRHGRANRLAVTGPAGRRSFAQLCADAAQWGNALLSLGLVPGDRGLF